MSELDQLLDGVTLKFVQRTVENALVYRGEKDGEIMFVVKKDISKPEDMLNFSLDNVKDVNINFSNQRYCKFNCNQDNVSKELTVIYPASPADIRKFNKRKIYMVNESYEEYLKDVEPGIHSQDLTWIKNIMNGQCEVQDILYEDEHFVILPDLKWDGKDMSKLYCLAIVKDDTLKSIRDFNGEKGHIDLLEHIENKSRETIESVYGVKGDQIRSYFHYHPSFWHVHIHYNLITHKLPGAIIDYSHTVGSVIENMKILPDYYQKASIPVIKVIVED